MTWVIYIVKNNKIFYHSISVRNDKLYNDYIVNHFWYEWGMNVSDNTQVVCKTAFCQNTIFLIKGNLKVFRTTISGAFNDTKACLNINIWSLQIENKNFERLERTLAVCLMSVFVFWLKFCIRWNCLISLSNDVPKRWIEQFRKYLF